MGQDTLDDAILHDNEKRDIDVISQEYKEAIFKSLGHEPTDRLFVGNLPFDTTASELKDVFSPFGISSVQIEVNKLGYSRGYGFLQFKTFGKAAVVLIAAKQDGFQCMGRKLTLAPASPTAKLPDQTNPTNTLYISRFNEDFPDSQAVLEKFLPTFYPYVLDCRTVMRQGNHSYGFVSFKTVEDSQRAKSALDRHFKENPEDSFYVAYAKDFKIEVKGRKTIHLSKFNPIFPDPETVVMKVLPESSRSVLHYTPVRFSSLRPHGLIYFKDEEECQHAKKLIDEYFYNNPIGALTVRYGISAPKFSESQRKIPIQDSVWME